MIDREPKVPTASPATPGAPPVAHGVGAGPGAGEGPAPAAGPFPVSAGTRSDQKRQAILAAATEEFLAHSYLGASMDEIAARSGVSKQTIYNHFASKEALFIAIVAGLTGNAGDAVHLPVATVPDRAALATTLEDYAYRQLAIVLTPRLMQLRRLVIGEVARFPDLARVLYEAGPQRAMTQIAELFATLTAQGLLTTPDPALAATHFNWLVMGEAVNRAMLLGDAAIPDDATLRANARSGVAVFLAAYGTPSDRGQAPLPGP